MKSKVETVTQVALGVLKDCQAAYPRAGGFMKDNLRITLGSNTRGISFFTIDLASCDPILLSWLEEERITGSGFLLKRKSKLDRRPRFLWDLWSRVFESTGMLVQDPDPNAILMLRQIFCLGKKLALDCSPERVEDTIKEYYLVESENREPINDWSHDDPSWVRCSFEHSFPVGSSYLQTVTDREQLRLPGLLRRLDSVSRILVSDLGYFSPLESEGSLRDRYQHGPGAVSDLKYRAYKFDFPTWPKRLEAKFPFDWCGSPSLEVESYPDERLGFSKLIAVPKTAKGPRLIASEPTCNQWCQQWIKNELIDRFRISLYGKFVNTLDQSLSRSLVEQASVSRDLATLDLSSASDRVMCRHVEALLSSNLSLLELCHAVRTPTVRDSISKPHRDLAIRKFAAMGSALTFPVQSMFFTAICLAASGAYNRKTITELEGRIRIFGDDLIVPTEAYADLVLLLTHLGLKVNTSKSFSKGYFRESCGLDAYKGVDVTPIKPKVLWCNGPEDYQSLVDTCNNLFKAGLWHASSVVRSIIQYGRIRPSVVPINSGLPGLESFMCRSPVATYRWNKNLHVTEFRLACLISKAKRVVQDKASALLQFYTANWSAERPRLLGAAPKPAAYVAYGWRALLT